MKAHKRKKKITPATPEELKLIEELTQRNIVERLETGESEVVEDFDWADAPELGEGRHLKVSDRVYRKLQTASREEHTTPERLADKLLSKCLAGRKAP